MFEAKFMLPWSFSEETAAEKYMAQLQHNMWVTHLRSAVLSIITGGGKWVEITISMDPLYLSVLVSAPPRTAMKSRRLMSAPAQAERLVLDLEMIAPIHVPREAPPVSPPRPCACPLGPVVARAGGAVVRLRRRRRCGLGRFRYSTSRS